ncbi:MAG: AAA family ATPase [Campylobacterota bacterium]|nr:AAA family ATPase [Campylobacterota bacterium]
MRLKLNNIGIIKEANITLDGLTVIAGENNSGKSTIGKIIYSLIKTIIKGTKRKGMHPPSSDNWCSDEFNNYETTA